MRSNLLRAARPLLLACASLALAACDSQGPDGAALGRLPRDGSGALCTVEDTCPASIVGITWDCKTRFMYGTNWAWETFGADFGGVAKWGAPGVAGDPGRYSESMRRMKEMGVNVIRWWMFPRFTTDSIQWNGAGGPSGIGGSLVADVQKALELAEQNDVYLMLTPFSFDNFYPTGDAWGVYARSMKPILENPELRRDLVQNLLKPVAQAVESSPYARRMIAWDIINEPEWAVHGTGLPGDAPFPVPNGSVDTVTHEVMEAFLIEATAVLHESSRALVSVGGAGIKWPKAWSRVGLDFYQFHYYDWLYENFPYQTVTLASVGVTDKPVVMGEFPGQGLSAFPYKGLPARTAAEFSHDLMQQGYAGSLSWALTDGGFPVNPGVTRSFADSHGCEVAY